MSKLDVFMKGGKSKGFSDYRFIPFSKNKMDSLSKKGINEFSRFLYVSGYTKESLELDSKVESSYELFLREKFEVFGKIEAIEFMPGKKYCFVCFFTELDASAAISYFQSNTDISNNLYVKYAQEKSNVDNSCSPEAECTSVTKDVIVDGCEIVNDFITEEEESALLDEIDGYVNILFQIVSYPPQYN